MWGFKKHISLIIALVLVLSIKAFPQQINYADSGKVNLKPQLNYTLGSTFTVVPHVGSLSGFTISPVLSIPLSPRLSVDGGIIAGRYYSAFRNFNSEGRMYGEFNQLSIYGSALYRINPKLSIYGSGIKQLAGTSPYNFLPKSSYTIGSTLNFGSFSIGAALQVSKWDDPFSPFLPVNNHQSIYSPY